MATRHPPLVDPTFASVYLLLGSLLLLIVIGLALTWLETGAAPGLGLRISAVVEGVGG